MDPERQRIVEDLRGIVRGEVRADDVFLQMYASDASNYQILPRCVLRPRSTDDVAACAQYASSQRIPIHARGAGTGLAGESLGPGIVVDFSTHMRRVLRAESDQVTVQPGVVHERLNDFLRRSGRHFGPDPATSHVTTLGGVAAVDGSGSHWLVHGSTRQHVRRLKIVLADGSVMDVGREPLIGGLSTDPDEKKRELINRLVELLGRERDTIAKHQPKTKVNRSGYHLHGVLTPEYLDLAQMLVGSEGTLALFTELTLATQPVARQRVVALLLFASLELAVRAVPEILAFRPSTCDLMDRRHLSLARETDSRYDAIIPSEAEALLLVEVEGNDGAEVRERMRLLLERVRSRKRLAFDTRLATGEVEMQLYWQLARKTTPTLHRLKGSTRAVPIVEDMAVPPESLGKFLIDMQNVLKKHQVTATLFAHAGHGQLHLRPFLDLANPEHVQVMTALADELYATLWSYGGTISGEHGDGLSRSSYVSRQYGDLYRVFREVKWLFDPHSILNPGKVIADDAQQPGQWLRPSVLPTTASTTLPEAPPSAEANGSPSPALPPKQLVTLQLNWQEAEIAAMARACNGCGACRTQSVETRMCPIFRFAPSEEASPRAKANLMRGILTGQLPADAAQREDFKEIADLCVNCHMCRLECPAGVDIPRLMMEAKAAYVAHDGMRFSEWILSRVDLFSSLGVMLSPLANWIITNPQARWLLEKITGLAQGRKLPRFARRSFMRWAQRRRLNRPSRRSGRKVLFFVDTFVNYHDPQLGQALVRILEHHGIPVYVPSEQMQSAMAMISSGAVIPARRIAKQNVAILAEAVRQGYTIVCTEPSTALCLSHEYPAVLNDDDTRLVAQNTIEACTYLWQLHQSGLLQLDLKPVKATLMYHQPCHVKALGHGSAGENLLRLVPGLVVQAIERGCSGMAGMFGLQRENYRDSLRAGWPLISALREGHHQAGTTECSACKIQMEQGSPKPTIHPLKILALAYGLMPEVQGLLNSRTQELTVT